MTTHIYNFLEKSLIKFSEKTAFVEPFAKERKEITYKDTWSGEYAFINPGYFDISQDTVKLDEAITEGVQYYFAFNRTSVYLRIKKEKSVGKRKFLDCYLG